MPSDDRPSLAQPQAPAPGPAIELVRLGPVLAGRLVVAAGVETALNGPSFALAQYVSLHFLPSGTVREAGQPSRPCADGDVFVVNSTAEWLLRPDAAASCPMMFVPRRYIAPALGLDAGGTLMPAAPALAAVGRLLGVLLREAEHGEPEEQAFLGRSLVELALAALVPDTLPAARREATLLERAIDAVDAAPGDPLDADALCDRLRCSRSALYRALAPAGGASALIAQRRLIAAHHRLQDPADTRSIAALALAHGFPDPVQFGRRFKRQFGLTPGAHRAAALPPAQAEPPWS